MGEHIPSYYRYVERYCNKDEASFGGRKVVRWTGVKRSAELNMLLTGTVMIRRLKKDVLTQLPAKRRQRIALAPDKLDSSKMKEVKECIQEQKALAEEAAASGSAGVPMAVSQTFKLTAEAKMESVAKYIEYLLSNEIKFLLFAHHHVMLDRLEKKLRDLSTDFIRIDGKTPQKERQDFVTRFQESDRVRVALLSITAAGTGLTLTAAHTVVFAELFWVPGQMMQAEDRAHRIGQHHPVEVHYCIAEGTLDEVMYNSLNKKSRETTAVLKGAETCMQAQTLVNPAGLEAWRKTVKRPAPEDVPATGIAKFFKPTRQTNQAPTDAIDVEVDAQKGA